MRRRSRTERKHRTRHISIAPDFRIRSCSDKNFADEANMRRVVVTGMGIVSSIGNNTQEVVASLREAKSGIVRADKYAELASHCQGNGGRTRVPTTAVTPPP